MAASFRRPLRFGLTTRSWLPTPIYWLSSGFRPLSVLGLTPCAHNASAIHGRFRPSALV